jgi:pimeloyl-ACP methyl ester carboxylesterase
MTLARASTALFKSPEGEATYHAAYDKVLALWDVPYECLRVATQFGTTHVIASGPTAAPPLVLLHGIAISSTMWYPNIADLSRDFRTFAVDVMGDAGKSVPSHRPKNRAEHAQWLVDVFNELHIEQADVAGLSYGGFLTLNFALQAPDRVKRIVLLAPAGCFVRFRLAFWLRMASGMFLSPRAAFKSMIPWISARRDAAESLVFEQMLVNWLFGRAQWGVWPRVFTDKELRSVSVPTLLLIGDREVIYDPRVAIGRATRLIPRIEVAIIPNASHFLTFDQSESVDARVLDFLKQ